MTTVDVEPEFRRRERCISCGSSNLTPVWQSTYRDPLFRENIGPDFYSVDVPALLAGHRFVRVRCDACSQSFHQYVLTDDWLARLYTEWIDEAQIARFKAAHPVDPFDRARQWTKHALRLGALLGGNGRDGRAPRLVDYGCGEGEFLEVARPFGFECIGVDIGTSRPRHDGDPITIVPTLDTLDTLAPGSIDAATLFQTLEHLAEPLEVLRQLNARMRDGAVLVVEVPDCSGIEVPRTEVEFHAVDPIEHINHFTPATLTAMCRRAGFEPCRRIPAHVTHRLIDVVKTELSRFRRPSTSRYFRKVG
ncbi:MAG TPA: class I SAM-dependent methyltransferase [Acidimicrobiales bacterium]